MTRTSTMKRKVLTGLVATVAALSAGMTAPAATAAEDSPECKPYVILAARGSGEGQVGKLKNSNGWEGDTLKRALKEMGIHDRDDVEVLGVHTSGNYSYKARAVELGQDGNYDIFGELHETHMSAMRGSSAAVHAWNQYKRDCQNQGIRSKLVLLGYSQGAMTLSHAEEVLVQDPQYAGTLYLGNPYARGEGMTTLFGGGVGPGAYWARADVFEAAENTVAAVASFEKQGDPTRGIIEAGAQTPHKLEYCLDDDGFCDYSLSNAIRLAKRDSSDLAVSPHYLYFKGKERENVAQQHWDLTTVNVELAQKQQQKADACFSDFEKKHGFNPGTDNWAESLIRFPDKEQKKEISRCEGFSDFVKIFEKNKDAENKLAIEWDNAAGELIPSEMEVKEAFRNLIPKAENVAESEEEISAGTAAQDTWFVIDVTGSMDDDIAAVKRQTEAIGKKMLDSNKNSRIGIIRFNNPGSFAGTDEGYEVALPLGRDLGAFEETLDGLYDYWNAGGIEYVYGAMNLALDSEWKQGNKRNIIVMTDEPGDDRWRVEEGGDLSDFWDKLKGVKAEKNINVDIDDEDTPELRPIADAEERAVLVEEPTSIYLLTNEPGIADDPEYGLGKVTADSGGLVLEYEGAELDEALFEAIDDIVGEQVLSIHVSQSSFATDEENLYLVNSNLYQDGEMLPFNVYLNDEVIASDELVGTISGLEPGEYTLAVRGQDARGRNLEDTTNFVVLNEEEKEIRDAYYAAYEESMTEYANEMDTAIKELEDQDQQNKPEDGSSGSSEGGELDEKSKLAAILGSVFGVLAIIAGVAAYFNLDQIKKMLNM